MDKTTYDFDIQNHLEYPIKLVPVSLEDTAKFELLELFNQLIVRESFQKLILEKIQCL